MRRISVITWRARLIKTASAFLKSANTKQEQKNKNFIQFSCRSDRNATTGAPNKMCCGVPIVCVCWPRQLYCGITEEEKKNESNLQLQPAPAERRKGKTSAVPLNRVNFTTKQRAEDMMNAHIFSSHLSTQQSKSYIIEEIVHKQQQQQLIKRKFK